MYQTYTRKFATARKLGKHNGKLFLLLQSKEHTITTMVHRQVISLMALAFSICVLTSVAQIDNIPKSQVIGLGVALVLILVMCITGTDKGKGTEMYAKSRTSMARRKRRSRMGNKESFFGGRGSRLEAETMTMAQPSPIPPMGSSGKRENRYYREGTDIKNAMLLQKLFNFNSWAVIVAIMMLLRESLKNKRTRSNDININCI